MSRNLNQISFVDAYALAQRVATNWETHYPNYSVDVTTFQDLGIKGVALKETYLQSVFQTNRKSENTKALADVQTALREALTKLRLLIKLQYGNADLQEHYRSYGMETPGEQLLKPKEGERPVKLQKNADGKKEKDTRPRKQVYFTAPKDNDTWIKLSESIIEKLGEDDNPLKNQAFGHEYWKSLRNRHVTLWNTSNDMRSNKSSLSRQSNEKKKEVLEILAHLKKRIRLDFARSSDMAKVLREFGFLNESL